MSYTTTQERKSIDCLEVTFDEDFPTSLYESDAVGKYAHKIYGYIGPPHTGISYNLGVLYS